MQISVLAKAANVKESLRRGSLGKVTESSPMCARYLSTDTSHAMRRHKIKTTNLNSVTRMCFTCSWRGWVRRATVEVVVLVIVLSQPHQSLLQSLQDYNISSQPAVSLWSCGWLWKGTWPDRDVFVREVEAQFFARVDDGTTSTWLPVFETKPFSHKIIYFPPRFFPFFFLVMFTVTTD